MTEHDVICLGPGDYLVELTTRLTAELVGVTEDGSRTIYTLDMPGMVLHLDSDQLRARFGRAA